MMCLFSKKITIIKNKKKTSALGQLSIRFQTKYEEEHYDIYERVFGDEVIDASWVNDTSVDEKYRDMPDAIRAYIKSFQEKVS